MSEERTVPRRFSGLPIKAVRAEVVAGPDRGKATSAREESVTVGTADGNDLVLVDPTVSRYHLELRRRADRIVLTDLGSTNGTAIGTTIVEAGSVCIPPGTVVTVGETQLRIGDGEVVMVDAAGPDALGELRGRSPAMTRLFANILRLAQKNVPVLLVGESGTGKELIARAIHQQHDPSRPFATVDCAATVPTLFASELFGHERGAFTGAERRSDGAFLRANGGTIFLDEVGELSLELQSVLLGVVERRRVRRLGSPDEIPVDVRIVCATNRDLRSEVNAGRFRLDLYYRLAVVLVPVPPLRERLTDIPLLVEHLLREAGHDGPVEDVFPPAAMAELARHTWPGNVRELRNVVEAALVMGATPPALGPTSQASGRDAGPAGQTSGWDAGPADTGESLVPLLGMSYRDARRALLDRFEREYLRALLSRTGGNVRQAARDARMDRSYLIELLKRHQLG